MIDRDSGFAQTEIIWAPSRFEVCKTKQGLGKRVGLVEKRGPGHNKHGLQEEQRASYEGALEAVLAVPIAAGLGYYWDHRFDSAPIGLMVGTGIGFLAMLLRLVRMRPGETVGIEPSALDRQEGSTTPTVTTPVTTRPAKPRTPATQTERATEKRGAADKPADVRAGNEECDRSIKPR